MKNREEDAVEEEEEEEDLIDSDINVELLKEIKLNESSPK